MSLLPGRFTNAGWEVGGAKGEGEAPPKIGGRSSRQKKERGNSRVSSLETTCSKADVARQAKLGCFGGVYVDAADEWGGGSGIVQKRRPEKESDRR